VKGGIRVSSEGNWSEREEKGCSCRSSKKGKRGEKGTRVTISLARVLAKATGTSKKVRAGGGGGEKKKGATFFRG